MRQHWRLSWLWKPALINIKNQPHPQRHVWMQAPLHTVKPPMKKSSWSTWQKRVLGNAIFFHKHQHWCTKMLRIARARAEILRGVAGRVNECASLWSKIEKTQTKQPCNHSLSDERGSELSEWANEWVQQRTRAKQTVQSKRTSERCERMSEQTSKWPSTSICILGCYRP